MRGPASSLSIDETAGLAEARPGGPFVASRRDFSEPETCRRGMVPIWSHRRDRPLAAWHRERMSVTQSDLTSPSELPRCACFDPQVLLPLCTSWSAVSAGWKFHQKCRKCRAVPKTETGIVRITPEQLDQFISESDRRGGPESPETTKYWKNMEYAPRVVVDKISIRLETNILTSNWCLYTEISGRHLNQRK